MSETRDLADGESFEMQGSGAKPYVLRNTGGVYSCSCPAWRNQSIAIEKRTCKHLRKLRGDAAETERVGSDTAPKPAKPSKTKASDDATATADSKAPPVLLAHSFAEMQPAIDPTGWWLSEKLDGVRAWWDGKRFLSRLGNEYLAPDWFIAGMPDFPLDGELWLGRKLFQRCVSIVRRQDRNELWRDMTYVVFDAPGIAAPFEERQAQCRAWIDGAQLKYLTYHSHERCKSREHLDEELRRVEALGGEGLMLREPGSLYVAGRSTTLLKVKSFLDTEARVVAYTKGAGRHAGRVGALEVELVNGTRFSVGTGLSDAEREDPPAIGSIVCVRYQELSDAGVPRFPAYIGMRDDAIWPADQ
ncbi:MAG: DNA ligase [Burkholderiales bacterium]|nr:DNA ligase [Burkholderiales bacterium]